MGDWRSRVKVSVAEEGTERPGSEIEAETTVQAPGPRSAIMAALRWAAREAPQSDPAYGRPPPDFEPVEPRTPEAAAVYGRRVRVRGRCVDENRDERGDYVEIELPDG